MAGRGVTSAPRTATAPAPARNRVSGTLGGIAHLQRTAGNRAVTALLDGAGRASVQRDGTDPAAEAARVAALQASYQRSVSAGNWRQAALDLNGFNEPDIQTRLGQLTHDQLVLLDAGARHAMPDYPPRVVGYITTLDAEANRVGFLIFQYERAIVTRDFDGAAIFLNAFNEPDILTKAGQLTSHDLGKLIDAAKDKNVGGGRLPKLLQAVAGGSAKIEVSEQVGGTVYTARGGYKYHLTPDAIQVDVGMNFNPDSGVTVPAANWFSLIAAKWNKFTAINADDAADRKRIDFRPFAGEGHDIDVSTGPARANAGHYYVVDTDAGNTVPHEFGHLLGLQDEYERDTNDFRAVTGQAPTGSATVPASAEPIARAMHDALFLSESWHEWHRTAERRRMGAVDAVCSANGIAQNYQAGRSTLTADVSAAYKKIYNVELSHDFMKQVDTDNDEFNGWRERTLGAFQQTSTSLMGDHTDHTHPVEPRHVRAFAGYVEKLLGRGHWSPTEDH